MAVERLFFAIKQDHMIQAAQHSELSTRLLLQGKREEAETALNAARAEIERTRRLDGMLSSILSSFDESGIQQPPVEFLQRLVVHQLMNPVKPLEYSESNPAINAKGIESPKTQFPLATSTPDDQEDFELPTFKNPKLFDQAFTHRSFLNESRESIPSNERLEFLGDSILTTIVTVYLFQRYRDLKEGELSVLRTALVNNETLAGIAKELKLGQYLKVSRGEERTEGRNNPKLLSDAYEAYIGALFLDQGIDAVNSFIQKTLLRKADEFAQKETLKPSKTILQEKVQSQKLPSPVYSTIHEESYPGTQTFEVGVYVRGILIATGNGFSKKAAEEDAASKALQIIQKPDSNEDRTLHQEDLPKEKSIYNSLYFDFDRETGRLIIEEEEVPLTPTESKLLELLIKFPNRLLPDIYITRNVWEDNSPDEQRNLRVYIGYLRNKIKHGRDNVDEREIIKNVRGRGYMYTDPRKLLTDR